jgi:nucleotide-binding universal stress UspA family protein
MTTSDAAAPRVVVGVDGSAESIEALRWAAAYAKATSASVDAVMSWHLPPAVGMVLPGITAHTMANETRASVLEALDKALVAVFGPATPSTVQARVTYGHPAVVLVDESRNADLLVVGNRGHGAFAGMQTGSVSMHCVNNAHCPVVVVRGATMEPDTR